MRSDWYPWRGRQRLLANEPMPEREAQRQHLLRRGRGRLAALPPDGEMALADPPAPVRMRGVFATQSPYLKAYLGRDDNDRYQIRYVRGFLSLRPGMVTSSVGQRTRPPVTFEHFLFLPALGVVDTMELTDGRLEGEYLVSPSELACYYAGGLSDMEAGLHRGLSIGFSARERPKMDRRDGSRFDPDVLRWGKIHVEELAILDLPALSDAGMVEVMGTEDSGDDAGNKGGKDDER